MAWQSPFDQAAMFTPVSRDHDRKYDQGVKIDQHRRFDPANPSAWLPGSYAEPSTNLAGWRPDRTHTGTHEYRDPNGCINEATKARADPANVSQRMWQYRSFDEAPGSGALSYAGLGDRHETDQLRPLKSHQVDHNNDRIREHLFGSAPVAEGIPQQHRMDFYNPLPENNQETRQHWFV